MTTREGLYAALDRFKRFQTLGRLRPEHDETRLALAEAALDAELWGEARAFLSDATGDRPSARACRLMAAVETSENGDSEAARVWLERAATADSAIGSTALRAAWTGGSSIRRRRR